MSTDQTAGRAQAPTLTPGMSLEDQAAVWTAPRSPLWHADPRCLTLGPGDPRQHTGPVRDLPDQLNAGRRRRAPCQRCAAGTALRVAIDAAEAEPDRAWTVVLLCPRHSRSSCARCALLAQVAQERGLPHTTTDAGVLALAPVHWWWDTPVAAAFLRMHPVPEEVAVQVTDQVLATAWAVMTASTPWTAPFRGGGAWNCRPVRLDLETAAAAHL